MFQKKAVPLRPIINVAGLLDKSRLPLPAPRVVNKWPVSIEINDPVNHVYVASPDYHGGALVELPFTHKDGKLSFVVPSLKYWDMLIIE